MTRETERDKHEEAERESADKEGFMKVSETAKSNPDSEEVMELVELEGSGRKCQKNGSSSILDSLPPVPQRSSSVSMNPGSYATKLKVSKRDKPLYIFFLGVYLWDPDPRPRLL